MAKRIQLSRHPRSAVVDGGRRTIRGGVMLAVVGVMLCGCSAQPSPFVGLRSNGRELTFICDGSSAMVGKWAALSSELDKAVTSLRPPQRFNLIILHDGTYSVLDENQMLEATPTNKVRVFVRMDSITPGGAARVGPALQLAMSQHPQLIFVVVGGDFADRATLAQQIRELNPKKAVRVNTVEFLDRDPACEAVLKEIAADSGGTYRYVSRQELVEGRDGKPATAPATQQEAATAPSP
jgi:hypothetical protein